MEMDPGGMWRWKGRSHCGGSKDGDVELIKSWNCGIIGIEKVPKCRPVPPHPWAGTLSAAPGGSNVVWDISRDEEAAPGQQLQGLDSAGMGENLERGRGSVCGSNPRRPSEGGQGQLGPPATLQNIPVFWKP